MWERELQVAADLARAAGDILLEIYATDFAVDFKGAENPVTEADRRANEFLVRALREQFPRDGVVAEESVDARDAKHGGRCWYVDPLDGTKEFIAKNGEFSVMIGLAVDGVATVGAVYQPSEDRLYRGARGLGAFLDCAGRTEPLHVSDLAQPSELGLIVSRSHRSPATDELVRRLGIRREHTSGSVGLKIGAIATRHADLYVHPSDKSWAWDSCAPEAVLVAAGGRFTDLAGAPFRYDGVELRNLHGILACNAAAFDAVLPSCRAVAQGAGLV